MPDEYITTDDTLAGADQLAAADGSGADSQGDALSLAELNQALGKNFPTREAAIKSVKDTYSYVGKVGQLEAQVNKLSTATPGVDTSAQIAELQTSLKETNFYSENPEYKEHKDLIRRFGNDPAEVVKDPLFTQTFAALKATAEAEKSKSVIHSSPRLGQATDTLSKAREAASTGNTAESQALAVQAVLEAYEKS